MEKERAVSQVLINNPRFNQLLESSRFFDVQFAKLVENNEINFKVLEILIGYFIEFVANFNISNEQVAEKHIDFLSQYKIHLKEFAITKKYPFLENSDLKKARIDYDIVLLCSTFLSYHRYLIFETFYSKINIEDNQDVLVVGVGPGIELAILNGLSKKTVAYDTDIGSFIKQSFPRVQFFEKHFIHEPSKTYDKIVLIEILEHLEVPENLLADCMNSLKPEGRIHFTTAVNIPQFDHLVNFELNDQKVEKFIFKNNFEIELKLDIPHNYPSKVEAYNCYYIIKKRR
jgi:SAM-dependent methyltransferase